MTSFMKLIGACGVALIGVGSPAFSSTFGAELFVNGDFETVGDDADPILNYKGEQPLHTLGNWSVYTAIPGWTAFNAADPPVPGLGIEIQTNSTLGAADSMNTYADPSKKGNYYVELESHFAPGGLNNSGMQQVKTGLGAGEYRFRFHYSPRTGGIGDNVIGWDVLGSVSGEIASGLIAGPSADWPAGVWTPLSTVFALSTVEDVTFRIYAGGNDNTLGGFIDNASLMAVMPLPGPILFVLTAFGLAGAVRRVSRSA